MSMQLVFVYGSLRRGGPGGMPVKFPNAVYAGEGKVRGRLYDLGAYPALWIDDSGPLVTGEVYEVTDETLSKLDQFELTSDYQRRRVDVEFETQQAHCWIYVPARDISFFSGLPLIKSGDWIKHLGARRA
jgi:gamma-glutamylcyclotransferase (GGCT)/AIG2-like uncharacterized protein YtfP